MRPEDGATTHPELVCGVIEYLQFHGFRHLSIMESSWVGERTSRSFAALGYTDISEKYGVPLIDLQKDEAVSCNASGMETPCLPESAGNRFSDQYACGQRALPDACYLCAEEQQRADSQL